jgi:hypothetical protein
MMFYRYIYFRVYGFFENLNSPNAHSMALGIMTLPIGLLIYKSHLLISKYVLKKTLAYDEIAIPYLIIFLAVYGINYFLLQKDSKYLETEESFKRKEQPKSFDFLFLIVLILVVIIFAI